MYVKSGIYFGVMMVDEGMLKSSIKKEGAVLIWWFGNTPVTVIV